MLQLRPNSLGLQTRKSTNIANDFDPAPPLDGLIAISTALKAKYVGARHRETKPSNHYNCHGLTFAARRTRILEPIEIDRILKEDAYERVKKPEVGDIAVYRSAVGEIEHSGIVVEVLDFGTRILSKWGPAHEVVHMLGDCPYDASRIEYHRVTT